MTQLIASCSQSTFGLSLGVVHCLGSDRCVRTCIHRHGSTQAVFTKLPEDPLCASGSSPRPSDLGSRPS